jgi:type VI secretion system secreted protein Hcp
MAFYASINIKGAHTGSAGGAIYGISHGNTTITPRNFGPALSSVKAQYDMASGQLTGRRTHSPLVITKKTDSASPNLFQHSCSNEVLNSVVINIIGRQTSGKGEKVYYTINLTNAQISKISRYLPPPAPKRPGSEHVNTNELEQVEFTFQKITYTNLVGSTTTTDDWMANG